MNYLIDPVDLAYYLSIEEYQSITDDGYICSIKIEDLEKVLFYIIPEENYEEAKKDKNFISTIVNSISDYMKLSHNSNYKSIIKKQINKNLKIKYDNKNNILYYSHPSGMIILHKNLWNDKIIFDFILLDSENNKHYIFSAVSDENINTIKDGELINKKIISKLNI
jgi:hypothetical protein